MTNDEFNWDEFTPVFDLENDCVNVEYYDYAEGVLEINMDNEVKLKLTKKDLLALLEGIKANFKKSVDLFMELTDYQIRTSYPRSKWDILYERGQYQEMWGLELTTASRADGSTLMCCYCRTPHYTEGDFARHYIVTDTRYLNLGECPFKQAAQKGSASQ